MHIAAGAPVAKFDVLQENKDMKATNVYSSNLQPGGTNFKQRPSPFFIMHDRRKRATTTVLKNMEENHDFDVARLNNISQHLLESGTLSEHSMDDVLSISSSIYSEVAAWRDNDKEEDTFKMPSQGLNDDQKELKTQVGSDDYATKRQAPHKDSSYFTGLVGRLKFKNRIEAEEVSTSAIGTTINLKGFQKSSVSAAATENKLETGTLSTMHSEENNLNHTSSLIKYSYKMVDNLLGTSSDQISFNDSEHVFESVKKFGVGIFTPPTSPNDNKPNDTFLLIGNDANMLTTSFSSIRTHHEHKFDTERQMGMTHTLRWTGNDSVVIDVPVTTAFYQTKLARAIPRRTKDGIQKAFQRLIKMPVNTQEYMKVALKNGDIVMVPITRGDAIKDYLVLKTNLLEAFNCKESDTGVNFFEKMMGAYCPICLRGQKYLIWDELSGFRKKHDAFYKQLQSHNGGKWFYSVYSKFSEWKLGSVEFEAQCELQFSGIMRAMRSHKYRTWKNKNNQKKLALDFCREACKNSVKAELLVASVKLWQMNST
ncbi:hypothetical protein KAFR_0I02460 [Kazachstania africana CBS 2517]|uniref:Uncharacterized protein n=1 Tax=Kazachstania africana (strain ATCC 22294 / BCRC 22015 / CBS 2517 / CECT 1963 / NBRC 1671 / NRRL Y-8276) TaxID=1071382 RepID=H2B075_KAZAF|nr:hypothetical protein KAFR_0I02460 [Kazachstania africana CBS 2517]CCF60025.1 hypothetical protein KAFR_0I02460 [Kazachstania africana CBS 2517]